MNPDGVSGESIMNSDTQLGDPIIDVDHHDHDHDHEPDDCCTRHRRPRCSLRR